VKANATSGAALTLVAGISSVLGGAGAGAGAGCGAGEPAAQVAAALSAAGGAGGDAGAGGAAGDAVPPRVVYLLYADGSTPPAAENDACRGRTPPRFQCNFGTSLLDCQTQVQTYLDRWYADFNVVFTVTRPTSGPYYTEIVSSGGGTWCGADARVAGVAPFLCGDIDGGVAYTFRGGDDAKQTAIIIAQEQAHLVGLEHTDSNKDLMFPTICTDCDGFEDVEDGVQMDCCDRPVQNSYQMMKERLGLWGGGPKPSAFACVDDQQAPSIRVMEPADRSPVGHDFALRIDAQDNCSVKKVEVDVSPQILHAVALAPPYEWDLTNITGRQTISVTATDEMGRRTTSTITVDAPVDPPSADAPGPGCRVAGDGAGAARGADVAGALVGLGLTVARRRRARRR
jgi:hypothetical protein